MPLNLNQSQNISGTLTLISAVIVSVSYHTCGPLK